jgi:hypothetical protein
VGLVVCTLAKFPEHAPDGNLTQIPPTLIERWAGWEGKRGRFDAELRSIFLTDGVWSAWEKHNGTAMRDAIASRKRAADYRRKQAEELAQSTANGTPNGTANGAHLRTNGRTNITTGGRKRPLNGTDTYTPGHANLPEPQPCHPDCELVAPEGAKRFHPKHAEGCANA